MAAKMSAGSAIGWRTGEENPLLASPMSQAAVVRATPTFHTLVAFAQLSKSKMEKAAGETRKRRNEEDGTFKEGVV